MTNQDIAFIWEVIFVMAIILIIYGFWRAAK